ncbi:MAG: nucleotidyltransferase [Nevskiaceae bacterium]|nr:MAG: nucleotidyltransferase [Nevskiaceae bacterium]TBR73864.1 MAG: nucleotidyltransferase [Nevskiaceae bacterium]
MLLEELRRKRAEILAIAAQHGARDVRVFGSVARGEERQDSDVDILVTLPRGYSLFRQRLPLARELEGVIGRRLDMIPEHELNPFMRTAILKEAVPL